METSKFYDGNSNELKKVFTMQATPDVVIARLILNKNSSEYKERFSFQFEGNTFTCYIKTSELTTMLNKASLIPIKEDQTQTHLLSSWQVLLTEYQDKIYYISIFLFVLIALAIIVKKLTLTKNGNIYPKDVFQAVSSFNVGNKKSILLLKVFNRKLLLGVTSDNNFTKSYKFIVYKYLHRFSCHFI